MSSSSGKPVVPGGTPAGNGLSSAAASISAATNKQPPTTFIPPLHNTSPPSKNAVSSSELLSMLKKVPAPKDDQQQPQQNVSQTPTTITDDRGMLGLLQLIKSSGTAANLAAVGIDLEALGLALDSTDPVTKDWESPFYALQVTPSSASGLSLSAQQGTATTKVPSCYILPPSITLNPASKLTHFSDETLLYLFYAFPKDRLQELAGRELTARSWRYHKDLQQWLCVEGEISIASRFPSPSSRIFTMYFDPASWSRVRREVLVERDDQIEDRFLKR